MSHRSQDDCIAAIEAENRHLRHALEAALAQNTLLRQRVQDLEARLVPLEIVFTGQPLYPDML